MFGEVFSRARAIPTGNLTYLDFMAPGILAQSVLFVAIFYGIAIIWERDLGIVHKFLASPTPRTALVLGKALSAGVRALAQAVIIYVLALLLKCQTAFAVILGAALFSTFSLIVACIVKTRERFMGIGQVLTMPLFFASNAIYPISIMPTWLKGVARVNPLTYEVDALRAMMLAHGTSSYGNSFRLRSVARRHRAARRHRRKALSNCRRMKPAMHLRRAHKLLTRPDRQIARVRSVLVTVTGF